MPRIQVLLKVQVSLERADFPSFAQALRDATLPFTHTDVLEETPRARQRQRDAIVARWVEEKCRQHEDARERSPALHDAFYTWYQFMPAGTPVLGPRQVSNALRRLGFTPFVVHGHRYWRGLALRNR